MTKKPDEAERKRLARQQAVLDRAPVLLRGLFQHPELARAALQVGYTSAVHQRGWALYTQAGGGGRRPETIAAFPDFAPLRAEREACLDRLDAFENRWFPLTRLLLENRLGEPYAKAFFHGLRQHPRGAGVVLSVGIFLDRFRELRAAAIPGAPEICETLETRGLRAEDLAAAAADCEVFRRFPELPEGPRDVLAAEIEAQDAALVELNAWYREWSETLRGHLPPRDCVRLGLMRAAPGRPVDGQGVSRAGTGVSGEKKAGSGGSKPPRPRRKPRSED